MLCRKGPGCMKADLLEQLRSGAALSRKQQTRLILQLSWPAIVGQLSVIAMQYIDAAMVGRLGSNESAAIGLVASTTWLFMELLKSANIGFSILVAQSIGARDNVKARNILHQGLAVTLALSLLLMAIGSAVSGALPRWLGAESAIWADASAYFLVFALSLPFLELYRFSAFMLRASGNMRIPGISTVIMCLLDVVFNALLIFPTGTITIGDFLLPGAGLGVLGAALGTALSYVVSALFLLPYLLLRSPELKLHRGEKTVFSRTQLQQCLRIALPVAGEMMVTAVARIFTTRITAPLGTIAIAANSFGLTIEALCYMPGYGMQSAASTLIGQSIGAKRRDITYPLSRLVVGLGMGVMLISGILMYLFAPQMMALLSPDPAVIALGTQVLRIEAFSEPLYAACLVAGGVFQGAGSTLASTVITAAGMWGIRVPLSALLAPRFGLHGVWFAMALQLTVCGIFFLIRLHRRRWLPADMREAPRHPS